MELKFKKEDLNECMLFKLRGHGLCVALTQSTEDTGKLKEQKISFCLFSKSYIGRCSGISSIKYSDKDLNSSTMPEFDIMAIKQFRSQSEVLKYVLNDKEPEKWDWVRDEKSEKEIQLEELIHKLENQLDEAKNELEDITGNFKYVSFKNSLGKIVVGEVISTNSPYYHVRYETHGTKVIINPDSSIEELKTPENIVAMLAIIDKNNIIGKATKEDYIKYVKSLINNLKS